MFEVPFYNETIRNVIVSFGNLFSNIKIQRKSDGVIVQTIHVPLAYGPKDKAIVRTESDPKLEENIYTLVPRITFEILGYTYDAQRKTSRLSKITCDKSDGTRSAMFSPAPWNLDITMYLVTKNGEDAFTVLEQILPIFTPEYTLSINAIPEFNLISDVPVILNSVTVQDDYDGDFQIRRFVTHTFNFQLKINLFGEVDNHGVIKKVIVPFPNQKLTYEATGTLPGDPVVESWTLDI